MRAAARGGRESSIDRQDLDGWERRTGGKGQVAWGLTTRVGEQRTKNSTDEKTARDAEGFK